MKEKPEQSLESKLKMARPRRAEVKRVPLTPEEKEFLGEIMKKAVAAEKAGKLAEALEFYTDYKNELLKIKDNLEKEGKWDRQRVIKWAKRNLKKIEQDIEKYVNDNFIFDETPMIKTKSSLEFYRTELDELPKNLGVQGSLVITNSTIRKMPGDLRTQGNFVLRYSIIDRLPNTIIVVGLLDLTETEIKDKKIPKTFFVGEEVYVSKSNTAMIKVLEELKMQKKIIGDIKLVE